VVHANTACHIAFLLSLLGLDQRLLALGSRQSRDPWLIPWARAQRPVHLPNLEISGLLIQSWEMTADLGDSESGPHNHRRKPQVGHVAGYSDLSIQLLLR
jgi:hypothetical protein